MNKDSQNECRIDKWLWMVRVFKSRSLAIEACKGGKVKLAGDNVKPGRNIKKGEIYQIQKGILSLSLKVTDFPKNRVSASLVMQFVEDLTPKESYEALKMQRDLKPAFFDGKGRPTKKDRRQMDQMNWRFFDDDFE